MRDYRIYLEDIQNAVIKIERFTCRLSYREFQKDELVVDAVVRNLEIIGEAAKTYPGECQKEMPAY